MPENYLQRLAVPLVHGEKKEWQHNKDHDHGCQRHVSGFTEKKKERQSCEDRSSEAEDLTSGEIKKQFAFHTRQVSGYIGIEIVQRLAPFCRIMRWASGLVFF